MHMVFPCNSSPSCSAFPRAEVRLLLLDHLYFFCCPLQNPPSPPFLLSLGNRALPFPLENSAIQSYSKQGVFSWKNPSQTCALQSLTVRDVIFVSSSKGSSCLPELCSVPGAAVPAPRLSLPSVRALQWAGHPQHIVSLPTETTSTGLWPYCRLWELESCWLVSGKALIPTG